MDKYFYEVFENIPRQGPGMNSSTRKAYKLIKINVPEKPEILDIGCGKGIQTIELARISEGEITAIDNYPYFLDCLQKDAERSGFSNKIKCIQADMNKMPFGSSSFDLIWSEGAVFVMGIKEGLKSWKSFLKQKGYIVLTDLVWLTDSRPDEITNYFEEECLYVLTIPEVIAEAERNGYDCPAHFTLPDKGWTDEYFLPQQQIIDRLRKKYKESDEARQTFDALEYERELVTRSFEYVGYEFFIFRKT